MFCQKCGKKLPEGSTYCSFCGSNTENSETEKKEAHDFLSLSDKRKSWGQ